MEQLIFDGPNTEILAMMMPSFVRINSHLAPVGPNILEAVHNTSEKNNGDVCVAIIIWNNFDDFCRRSQVFPCLSIVRLADINTKDRALVMSVITGPDSKYDKKTDYIILQTLVRPNAGNISCAAVFDAEEQKKHFAEPKNRVDTLRIGYNICEG